MIGKDNAWYFITKILCLKDCVIGVIQSSAATDLTQYVADNPEMLTRPFEVTLVVVKLESGYQFSITDWRYQDTKEKS